MFPLNSFQPPLLFIPAKNPTTSPAWIQISAVTFAVLLVFLETELKCEIKITPIQ